MVSFFINRSLLSKLFVQCCSLLFASKNTRLHQ
nr:MAG TPA: hypothetical protein [Caudoviricetes sp.]